MNKRRPLTQLLEKHYHLRGDFASERSYVRYVVEQEFEYLSKHYETKDKDLILEKIRSILTINRKRSSDMYIPQPFNEIPDNYILDEKKLVIVSDIHFPHHDPQTLEVVADKLNDDTALYINGDALDCYEASRFDKKPTVPKMKEEFEMFAKWVETIKCKRIYFKIGNHEERWEKSANKTTFALFKAGSLAWILEHEFGLKNLTFIESKQFAQWGKVFILHGHECQSGAMSPIGIARSVGLKTYSDTIVGHSHQTNSFPFKRIDDSFFRVYSAGCACSLKSEYARVNRWNNGFIEAQMYEDGDYSIFNWLINEKGRLNAM
jgi:predicted phosphodiesterase